MVIAMIMAKNQIRHETKSKTRMALAIPALVRRVFFARHWQNLMNEKK